VRASFRRSITLAVTIYQTFDEVAFTPGEGDNPIVPYTGYLIPWKSFGFVMTGDHGIWPKTPTEESFEVDEYLYGPREDYFSPDTDHRKALYRRVLATTAGVDLFGRIPVTASATMSGTHDNYFLNGGEPRITTKWPVSVGVTATFYPRNLEFFSPYTKTWRGLTSDTEQRFTHKLFISYSGAAGFFADAVLRESVAATWGIDVSPGLRIRDLTSYTPGGFGSASIDIGTGV
jgi:hypothetical protein